jgi:hypothetical protein
LRVCGLNAPGIGRRGYHDDVWRRLSDKILEQTEVVVRRLDDVVRSPWSDDIKLRACHSKKRR